MPVSEFERLNVFVFRSASGDECSFRKDKKLMGHRTFAQQKMGCERKKIENH